MKEVGKGYMAVSQSYPPDQSQIATLSQPAGQENGLKIFVCVDTEKAIVPGLKRVRTKGWFLSIE